MQYLPLHLGGLWSYKTTSKYMKFCLQMNKKGPFLHTKFSLGDPTILYYMILALYLLFITTVCFVLTKGFNPKYRQETWIKILIFVTRQICFYNYYCLSMMNVVLVPTKKSLLGKRLNWWNNTIIH